MMEAKETNITPQAELPILEVEHLRVQFTSDSGTTTAVVDESFSIRPGETLALVGESGSGKSVTSLSVMRLVEHGGGKIVNGSIKLRCRDGRVVDLRHANKSELQHLRGSEVAMIFQEPMTSLNPVFTVGAQIAESLILHRGMDEKEALKEAVHLLELVRIPDAERISLRFPHQLSGGMRQRVMIAMALACKPQLLIADEPTTALDVTVQAQILALISELQKEIGMAVLFITHDMGVVAQIADRVAVMRYGEIVESGTAQAIFAHPQHPYTQALLSAVPRLGALKDIEHPCFFRLIDPDNGKVIEPPSDKLPPPGETILEVKNLVKTFPVRTDFWGRPTYVVRACDHVSFDLRAGETLSIVGESGCGKSTTGRAVLRLLDVDSGEVLHRGKSLLRMTRHELQEERRNLQMIFQDPYASLDPRQTVGYSIAEPMMIHNYCSKKEMYDRVALLLKRVGLSPDMANRYPHEFSGGQRQRICIARALSLKPQIIVADECVAALDVSIRAQVVNLMMELQEEMGLSYIFISHDMGVVERISHRVAVMYLGQIVEMGSRRAVLGNPLHPYTQKLLSAVPIADPQERNLLKLLNLSDLPSPVRKVGDDPVIEPLVEVEPGHFVAKHVVGTMEGHK
ncbi:MULTISPECIES: dipeptide ABC transporter ATP-binding protein [Sutterella]|jgi:glutathione transport system ATP-binding protein|uniref:ABC transporter ATP-binding protein n=2 Tax=Sutterellaceae TaxID=995019 RepID=UPI000DEB1F0A|nr:MULTISPECIES: dipeptide ABC transporter ATP-binding protein [Sutterella]MDR3967804.1 dipeptide ABC transporter ATP-binding protein [Sutterella sp.]QQS90375.1 dipeptide ABC transporter ATP-binding protein [Sutterella wadsworthensis]RBP54268.1 glutathione transport system ATP-binding protein [Sutterella wadsworthensis]